MVIECADNTSIHEYENRISNLLPIKDSLQKVLNAIGGEAVIYSYIRVALIGLIRLAILGRIGGLIESLRGGFTSLLAIPRDSLENVEVD